VSSGECNDTARGFLKRQPAPAWCSVLVGLLDVLTRSVRTTGRAASFAGDDPGQTDSPRSTRNAQLHFQKSLYLVARRRPGVSSAEKGVKDIFIAIEQRLTEMDDMGHRHGDSVDQPILVSAIATVLKRLPDFTMKVLPN